MITIHGIKNCDTMKKARAWLDSHAIAHAFHDYRVQGISAELLRPWLAEHGWQALLNRAGTTFRKLPETEREALDEARAIALMLAQPAVIKRPVLDLGARRIIGFSPATYAAALAP